jgi:transmembrane 9 superfamily protein 2/4
MFPFAVVLVELYVTLSSLWLHRVHYLFGFLAVVLLLMMVSSAQISVITTYMHLQREDYKWHWRAFVTPALSAVYLFICATVYFAFRLHIANMLSWFVLALYCLLLCMCLSVMVGAVGYLAAFVFMRKIYSAIKTD